jgi:hypothetical protein
MILALGSLERRLPHFSQTEAYDLMMSLVVPEGDEKQPFSIATRDTILSQQSIESNKINPVKGTQHEHWKARQKIVIQALFIAVL